MNVVQNEYNIVATFNKNRLPVGGSNVFGWNTFAIHAA